MWAFRHEVPSIPWSGDGLTCELTAEGEVPDDVWELRPVLLRMKVSLPYDHESRNFPKYVPSALVLPPAFWAVLEFVPDRGLNQLILSDALALVAYGHLQTKPIN